IVFLCINVGTNGSQHDNTKSNDTRKSGFGDKEQYGACNFHYANHVHKGWMVAPGLKFRRCFIEVEKFSQAGKQVDYRYDTDNYVEEYTMPGAIHDFKILDSYK